jgi:hypothetical protein
LLGFSQILVNEFEGFSGDAAGKAFNHRWTQINTDKKAIEATHQMPRQTVSTTPRRIQLDRASEDLCPSVFICG